MVVFPQTRSRAFRGVDKLFQLDGMKLFKNIRTYGWALLPQTRPSSIDGVENLFVGMLCSQIKTFKFMARSRYPTSPVTAQIISRRWRIISFWCYADFQQGTNERMVVLPQTRSRWLHGVEDSSHLDGMKLFRNTRTYGWAFLPQTRPSSFHGVEEPFRLDVMQPVKHFQVDGWAALPNFFCHCPAHFAALKNHFVLILRRLSTTFKWTDGRAPPNVSAHFTGLKTLFILIAWRVSTKFELRAGPCYFIYGPVFFTVLKNLFVWMLCSHVKTFKFMAGPRSPTSPVTAQLILRRWKILSFWCYADFKQRLNERMVVLPQAGSTTIYGVEKLFRVYGMKLFKNNRFYGWVVFPQIRPSSFHGAQEPFRLDVMQTFKHIQVYGWAALPNIPCHGLARFAALKNHFGLMLCRLSTTFKRTTGRAPPSTVQLYSRCWKTFSFSWYEAFQKPSNSWLGYAPPNTAQFFSRCWKTISSGCYAVI